MEIKSPKSLSIEHEALHSNLKNIISLGGGTGEAAKAVGKLLHPHFLKEEEFAMPPLSLLAALAQNKITSQMKDVVKMTEKLKSELSEMLEEHKIIVAALQRLIEQAKLENKPEAEDFAKNLMLHAQTEEEVLYPASILAGEFLKLKIEE